MLQALLVVSEQMALQLFEERADILGVLQEPLWTKDAAESEIVLHFMLTKPVGIASLGTMSTAQIEIWTRN